MSHFKVVVIGDDWENQLAPFDESTRVEPYRAYESGTPAEHWMFKILTEEDSLSADAGWAEFAQKYSEHYADSDDADGRMFYDSERGQAYQMTTYNPQSHWDWYSLGGRYMGSLLVKQGATAAVGKPGTFDNGPRHDDGVDQARVKDIDWAEMRARQRKLAKEHHAELVARHAKDPHDIWLFGLTDEQIEMALTDPERYINTNSAPFTCFAVVKDGEWFEKGRMGWFGMTTGEVSDIEWQQKLSELLATLDGETLLTVVDCHI
jgi:hypothetical protein